MSYRWWSADIHANHANICIYCGRPWLRTTELTEDQKWVSQEAALACAARMNDGLVRNFNERVAKNDQVVHVGDFSTSGKVNGISGLREPYTTFLSRLNGDWTLLTGNHDKQGKVKTIGPHLFTWVGGVPAFVTHRPTDDPRQDPELIEHVRKKCKFAIVGHVHKAWAVKRYDDGFLDINVGVDVRNYRPVRDDELVGIYRKETKT